MKVFGLSVKGKDHEENEDSYLIDRKRNLFAVADGVSIPKGGREAAKFALKFLKEFFKESLKEAVELMNKKIVELRITEKCGFTTLTAFHVKNTKAQLCWIGDSPAFLIREGKISVLTSFEDVHGNILLQAIGEENINVHERFFEIREGDLIIICTDGISSVLSQNEILSTALEKKTPEKICRVLIKEAEMKENIYRDDKTVIVVKL